MCYTGYDGDVATQPISFRPNAEDQRILDSLQYTPTEALRQGLRLLDYDRWLEQFHAEIKTLADEDLSDEPDAW